MLFLALDWDKDGCGVGGGEGGVYDGRDRIPGCVDIPKGIFVLHKRRGIYGWLSFILTGVVMRLTEG